MTIWVLLALPLPFVSAQQNPPDELSQQIRSIEDRIKRIEVGQKEITERQKEILEAIQNLRAWIRSS